MNGRGLVVLAIMVSHLPATGGDVSLWVLFGHPKKYSRELSGKGGQVSKATNCRSDSEKPFSRYTIPPGVLKKQVGLWDRRGLMKFHAGKILNDPQ